MIEIDLFKRGDWFEITDSVESVFDPILAHNDDFFKLIDDGVSITVREDGEVTACGGVVLYDNNNGGLWMKISKKAAEKPMLLLGSITDCFKIIRESIGDIRIIAHVRDGFIKGERTAKFFGFEKTDIKDGDLNTYVWKGK